MSNNKSIIALCVFSFACIAGLVSDFYWSRWVGWNVAHTFSHFCFGLGFPFIWVVIFSSCPHGDFQTWGQRLYDHVLGWVGDGFWLGVGLTELWSIEHDVFKYPLSNPTHGSDWHHWLADLVGIIVAYRVYRGITKKTISNA